MNIVVKMKFGSHLYGTNDENSDTDYKGIFLPTKEQIFLCKIPKSINLNTKKIKGEGIKNSATDIDSEFYSLHYFLKLACEGQTVAIDMLHAPETMVIQKSDIWDLIVSNKEKFYTKNLKAFIGYARKQAAKYGIKGSRLNTAKEFLKATKYVNDFKIKEIWDKLPITEHSYFIGNNPHGIKQYQICGKIIQESMYVRYAREIINKYHKAYGERAKQAERNEFIDWKAVSHALRAAYQVKELLLYKNITFPLKEASFLKKVKTGKLDYLTEVNPVLEKLMVEVEELSNKSDLPKKVDYKFWDNFLIETIDETLITAIKTKNFRERETQR